MRIFLCISLTCGCSHIHVLSLSLRWHLLLRISCKYVLIKMLYAQNLRVIQINMVFGTMMYSHDGVAFEGRDETSPRINYSVLNLAWLQLVTKLLQRSAIHVLTLVPFIVFVYDISSDD